MVNTITSKIIIVHTYVGVAVEHDWQRISKALLAPSVPAKAINDERGNTCVCEFIYMKAYCIA